MSGPFQRPPPQPTPPLKGSFPLDHDSQCKREMFDYMQCLNSNRAVGGECKYLAKIYLQCRMDKGLMESDDFSRLGFKDEDLRKAEKVDVKTRNAVESTTAFYCIKKFYNNLKEEILTVDEEANLSSTNCLKYLKHDLDQTCGNVISKHTRPVTKRKSNADTQTLKELNGPSSRKSTTPRVMELSSSSSSSGSEGRSHRKEKLQIRSERKNNRYEGVEEPPIIHQNTPPKTSESASVKTASSKSSTPLRAVLQHSACVQTEVIKTDAVTWTVHESIAVSALQSTPTSSLTSSKTPSSIRSSETSAGQISLRRIIETRRHFNVLTIDRDGCICGQESTLHHQQQKATSPRVTEAEEESPAAPLRRESSHTNLLQTHSEPPLAVNEQSVRSDTFNRPLVLEVEEFEDRNPVSDEEDVSTLNQVSPLPTNG